MNELRDDRIAAAIGGVDDWRGVTDPAILADAVIEALGLRQEYDPYVEPESSRYRYVTEWTTDD
jgi:hypothetical protein